MNDKKKKLEYDFYVQLPFEIGFGNDPRKITSLLKSSEKKILQSSLFF